MNIPLPSQRAVVPSDTAKTPGTPTELHRAPVLQVFTPSVTDENGEPLRGVKLANESGTLAAVTDSLGQAPLPEIKAGETVVVSIDNSVIRRFTANSRRACYLFFCKYLT